MIFTQKLTTTHHGKGNRTDNVCNDRTESAFYNLIWAGELKALVCKCCQGRSGYEVSRYGQKSCNIMSHRLGSHRSGSYRSGSHRSESHGSGYEPAHQSRESPDFNAERWWLSMTHHCSTTLADSNTAVTSRAGISVVLVSYKTVMNTLYFISLFHQNTHKKPELKPAKGILYFSEMKMLATSSENTQLSFVIFTLSFILQAIPVVSINRSNTMSLRTVKTFFTRIAAALVIASTTFATPALANGKSFHGSKLQFQLNGKSKALNAGFRFGWRPVQRHATDFFSNKFYYGSRNFGQSKNGFNNGFGKSKKFGKVAKIDKFATFGQQRSFRNNQNFRSSRNFRNNRSFNGSPSFRSNRSFNGNRNFRSNRSFNGNRNFRSSRSFNGNRSFRSNRNFRSNGGFSGGKRF